MNPDRKIKQIPLENIRIVNPRTRNQRKFQAIVGSIQRIGLKRPITVCQNGKSVGSDKYDLVCGQGRLEAFKQLGYSTIPAAILSVKEEDLLLMSLIENIARRNTSARDLIGHIKVLKDRGYSTPDIAAKIDVHRATVAGILRLLRHGEEGLLKAVVQRKIPVHIAVKLCTTEDKEVQRLLQEAYEKKLLTGKALLQTKRIIEQRKVYGKSLTGVPRKRKDPSSAESIVRTYKEETKRQKVFIQRAKVCENYLIFVSNALRQLLEDQEFKSLLVKEQLDSLPKNLAEKIMGNHANE